jgi:anaerobic selenocysteine-containing dehydrogenase
MPKAAIILLIVFSAALPGCGRGTGQTGGPGQGAAPGPGQAAAPGQAATPRLIHSPPIAQMGAEQLRSLSMECEKYVPDKSARGPYDAAYCEDAIAAWSDSPLQMLPIIKEAPVRDAPGPK